MASASGICSEPDEGVLSTTLEHGILIVFAESDFARRRTFAKALSLYRQRGNKDRHVRIQSTRLVRPTVFVEPGDHEPRVYLTAYLVVHAMAELERLNFRESLFEPRWRQIRRFRKRQSIPNQKRFSCLHRVMIEQKKGRIHETRQESPSACEHAMAFAPHDSNIAAKDVRDGVKDQIETFGLKAGEVGHIALNQFDVQPVSLRDQLIFRELFLRDVETCDSCSRCRENRNLLAATGCKAKHTLSFHAVKPGVWNASVRSEDDFPIKESMFTA